MMSVQNYVGCRIKVAVAQSVLRLTCDLLASFVQQLTTFQLTHVVTQVSCRQLSIL